MGWETPGPTFPLIIRQPNILKARGQFARIA
jgi:hypothetical protein